MDYLAEFLTSAPQPVVYGTVGAIIGASLAALGYAIEKAGFKLGRYAVIFAFALTKPAVEQVLMPAAQPSIDCMVAEKAAANTPSVRMDEITKFEAMKVDCVSKTIAYGMQVVAPSSSVDEGVWSGVAIDMNSRQCDDPSWRPFVDRGWRISNVYTFTDGSTHELVASCA
ncbi:MAG: hypothetical protein ABIQ30_10110 [Devosia sp.]